MKNSEKKTNLGIVFRPEYLPEALPGFARRAEEAGFDELWLWEDCFYSGGIASAATALAGTKHIAVGLGIMPAVARNPVFAAMEIAALAQLYPGRFLPGFGHGVAGWMRQIGAFPTSQLKALEEVTVTARDLLAGKRVSCDGQQVQLDDVELVHPPAHVPPVSLGVRGPKSLALSGRAADGTILAEYAAPAYVVWAREQIDQGRQEAGRDREQRITVFALSCAAETTAAARQEVRPLVAAAVYSGKIDAQLMPLGILPEVEAFRQSSDVEDFTAHMPDAWIDQLSIAGTKEDWQAAIGRYAAAGVHSLIFVPLPGKDLQEVDIFARLLHGLGNKH